MLERLIDRISAAMTLGGIYVLIGAVYFVVPATTNILNNFTETATTKSRECLTATDFTPMVWTFWPIDVYKTVSLAHRLDMPVEKVWIARWCFYDDDKAFEALRKRPPTLGSELLMSPELRQETLIKLARHSDGPPLSLSEVQDLNRR